MSEQLPSLAVLGGTGNLGLALARRWARAGYPVSIGSRRAEKAEEAAGQLAGETGAKVEGGANRTVAAAADIVVVTVPFAAQEDTLLDIREVVADKLVVDTTVPLVPPKVMRVQLPPEHSAARRARDLLGEGVRLVSAFHNVAAHRLAEPEPVECDVLVFGDDKGDRNRVVELAQGADLRGVHGGVLDNSVAAEALTSVLIFLNRHYGSDGAGIRLTGLDTDT